MVASGGETSGRWARSGLVAGIAVPVPSTAIEHCVYEPLLIIPAPTVTPVASSIRMNEPVVRFFE